MIDTVLIEGFKSIRSAQIDMRALNVLLGANGSGKSNLMGAFSLLRAFGDGKLRHFVGKAGGADRLLHFGSKTTETLRIGFTTNQDGAKRLVDFGRDDADGLFVTGAVTSPEVAQMFGESSLWFRSEEGLDVPEKYFGDFSADWGLFHFRDTSQESPLRKTSDLSDNHSLRGDGANLAAYLYCVQQRSPTAYQMIRRSVQLAAPFFEDFLLRPAELNPDTIRLRWRHRESDRYFDASSLSDGTLRFIALATMLLQPNAAMPSLALLDEPEIGLHPTAIAVLASLIKQASTRCQLIVATQSSILVDHFAPEDLLVADLVNGASRFRRLDGKRLADWLEEYSLGQLWENNEFEAVLASDLSP